MIALTKPTHNNCNGDDPDWCLTFILFRFISEDYLSLQIERLARTDSDFAPFLHHAGIPCVDLYYGKGTCAHLTQWLLEDACRYLIQSHIL